MPKRAVLLVGTSLMLFTLSACSSTAGPSVSDEMRQVTAVASTPQAAISNKIRQLADQCVRDRGFPVPETMTSPASRTENMLGLVDFFASPEEAEAIGYSTTVDRNATSEADSLRDGLSPADQSAYDAARLGDQADTASVKLANGATLSKGKTGCEADAAASVYGSFANALEVEAIQNDVLILASTSPSLGPALESKADAMSSCMRSAGYAVTGVTASAVAEKAFGAYRAPGVPPGAEEAKLASQDAACQDEVDLNDATLDAFFSDQYTWITDNADRLRVAAGIVTRAAQAASQP
jgi:hypothetical protein